MGSGWARLGVAVGGAILGGWILGPFLGASLGMSAGFMAGSYLGNMIFPTDYDTEMPAVHDYPVQNSAIGIPISIVFGTTRVAGNIIWMGDLTPYQIKHSSGGGGKGGGDEQKSYETRYRRSFLIAICEGPATISKAWKGKKEISLTEFTSYDGDNNSGISTLIGENYAEYSNLCLAYFEDYELGNSQRIPNFVFEVNGLPTTFVDYFVTLGSPNSITGIERDGTESWRVEVDSNKCAAYTNDAGELVIINMGNEGWKAYTGEGVPTGVESVDGPGNQKDILISDDNQYVYTCTGSGTGGIVYKFSLTTGVILATSGNIGYCSHICLHDGFIVSASNDGIKKLSPVDLSVVSTYTTDNARDIHFYYNVILDKYWYYYTRGANGIRCRDELTGDLLFQRTDISIALWEFIIYKNLVFVSGNESDGKNLWMLALDLTTEDSYSIGSSFAADMQIDPYYERVMVTSVSQEDEDGDTANVRWFWAHYLAPDIILEKDHFINPGATNAGDIVAVQYVGGSPGEGGNDVNFATMIRELLINERYGGYGESDLITEDFNSVITYCETNNLKGSLAITSQKPLPDWIAYICSHFQGYFYEIGGKIGLNCYRIQDSVLSIPQDDLIRDGDEPPVHITKRNYSSTFNRLEATWTNRDGGYKTGVVPAFDRIDQRESGQVRTKTMDLRAITNAELASKMTWRIFIDQIYRFSQYVFKLGYKSMRLEVGDVIDVTDGHLLVAKKMRVMSVNEEKDGRRALITAVEDISEFYPDISYAIQQSEAAVDPDIVLTDGTVSFRESYDTNKLYLSIVPGGTQCNGFYIYRSYDGASYDLVGKAAIGGVTGGEVNSTGTILSNLPAYTTVIHRSKEAFNVSIGTLTDLYTAVTDDNFFNNRKLAKIGNEIIAYKTCDESDVAGTWRVSNLIRGLFGTEAVAHVPDEAFNTLDIDFVYNLKESEIGKILYFKVVSFYGAEIQLKSEVSSQNYTVSGKYRTPLPVSLMRINKREGLNTYKTDDVTIDWYFCSKTSGFGRGGYGNALWGSYTKDPLLERLKSELEEENGTPITDSNFELDAYGEPTQLAILEADRDSNNPIIVKLSPMSNLLSDSREITIEKI